jgi:hypothetical protein
VSDSVDTVVRYTLSPEGPGTRLVLEHTGFSGLKAVMISFILGSGWKGHVREGIRRAVEELASRKA